MFGIELRRSIMLWLLPLTLVAGALVAWGWSETWLVWPEASATTSFAATRFSVVILAGVAAWSAQRDRRAGLQDQLVAASRPAWQVEAVHLLGTMAYAWIGLLLTTASIQFLVMSKIGTGFLWPSYLLLSLTTLTFSVAVGHLAGRLSGSRLVPPLMGTAMLVAGFLAPPNSPFDLSVVTGPAKLELSPAVLAARSMFAVACVMMAIIIPATRVSSRSTRQVTLPLLAGVVALGWLAVSGPLQVPRAPVARPLCGESAAGVPQVCVWPENRAYLNDATRASRLIASVAGGVVPLPATYYDEGLTEGKPTFTALSAIKPMIADMAIAAMPSFRGCADASEAEAEERTTVGGKVWVWLTARASGLTSVTNDPSFLLPGEVGRDVDAALAKPHAQQLAWVKQQVARTWEGCGG
ncbi:hypothetical protein FHS43_002548 [Streptosporangium becharense]|uniref:DUF7224 domain-containing protein n=1 Tax=Streptosporangium becharense TaxID=1816182 RepID=A0A7W9IJ20_9ACTN|nr:hypothetical protein [Streptosporangium becharense]MBB2911283.1 hypothetical protein [Streptosporangium becharense]MBB5821659.1 hypothetical protein [Streptosporangium becharense]